IHLSQSTLCQAILLVPDFNTLSLKTPILWGTLFKLGTTLPSFLARKSPFFLPLFDPAFSPHSGTIHMPWFQA
ncbi:MAG: hypothetical protein OXC02_04735, partial [Rhodobacteraceae bacterium]|nr:hypothetical protein [Paracoccaceae bacterium]